MRFRDGAIEEFMEIYEREFKEKISRDEATHMAARLVRLYRVFARPLPGMDVEEYKRFLEGAEASYSSGFPKS